MTEFVDLPELPSGSRDEQTAPATAAITFKGTPGPWCLAETESSVSFDNEDGPRLTSWQDIGVFETGAAVAIVLGFDEYAGEEDTVAEANARLIAAAPELLEALIEARSQLEEYELAASGEHYNSLQINAAIARALGSEGA